MLHFKCQVCTFHLSRLAIQSTLSYCLVQTLSGLPVIIQAGSNSNHDLPHPKWYQFVHKFTMQYWIYQSVSGTIILLDCDCSTKQNGTFSRVPGGVHKEDHNWRKKFDWYDCGGSSSQATYKDHVFKLLTPSTFILCMKRSVSLL